MYTNQTHVISKSMWYMNDPYKKILKEPFIFNTEGTERYYIEGIC